MGKVLLGLIGAAAAAALAAPAVAASSNRSVSGSQSGYSGGGSWDGNGDHHGNNNGGIWYYGGEWARYNNEAFKSDSFNDWWHDRPDRAYPAWMRNNQDCQKLWYSGGTLRC